MKKKLFMLLAAFLCLGAQAQAPVHDGDQSFKRGT